jgi:hypothetical protein
MLHIGRMKRTPRTSGTQCRITSSGSGVIWTSCAWSDCDGDSYPLLQPAARFSQRKCRGYNHAMDNTDNKELRERLVRLGASRLANALAYLSLRTEGGTEYVEALLFTLQEAEKRFKARLAGLKRRRKYIFNRLIGYRRRPPCMHGMRWRSGES